MMTWLPLPSSSLSPPMGPTYCRGFSHALCARLDAIELGLIQIACSNRNMPSITKKAPARNDSTGEDRKTGTNTPANIDLHPYARGSVIEVLHVEKENAEDWWSEPDSDSEQEDQERVLRLADIIDRAQTGADNTWRYYVHYRGLNRRMDEWIDIHRIVSPPSVGNSKAKALKKEEEKLKKQQEKKAAEEKAAMMEALEQSRGRVRRTASKITLNDLSEDTTRRTRLRRKTSTMDDDDTIVASNMDKDVEETPKEMTTKMKKEHVTLSDTTIMTHQVGEHVIATLKAQELDEHEGLDEASLREHEEVTKVKNVAFLELGRYQMETWYYSPLPKELLGPGGQIEVLFVCEFTFNMFSRKSEMQRYQKRIPTHARHPPGNEIYRKDGLAMFEVDGLLEKIYCQNLCYIAKLFLDHKTLYFDVDPFLFYVLCEVDDRGYHPVGYYSKEKYSDVGYNLACILVWPSFARKVYLTFNSGDRAISLQCNSSNSLFPRDTVVS